MSLKFLTMVHGRKRLARLSDQQLIELYRQNREPDVIDELFDRYVHLVFAICVRFLKDEEQSKDATMEIFSLLGDKLLNYSVKNFKSWFYQVSQNHCRMFLRKQKHFQKDENFSEYDRIFVEIDEEVNHESEIENNKLVHALLNKLKDCQRVCIEKMYFQNKSYKQISSDTGYSENAVKSYIQNGKRNLKKWIIDINGQTTKI